MAVKETRTGGFVTREFTSLQDFTHYIESTPFNNAFRWEQLSSSKTSDNEWSGTKSYDEAMDLLKHGWSEGTQKLMARIKLISQKEQGKITRMAYDIVGFTPSVPRYIIGLPTNMINKKQFPAQQKVITINKDFSYSCAISNSQIMEYSAATLQLVKKVEELGYRVNLNVIWGTAAGGLAQVIKVRIKNANERLNLSKMAFPLAHTSMLRRLGFRYLETAPEITWDFVQGYGSPLGQSSLRAYCKGEYLLPRETRDIDSIIKSMDLVK
jgi:hypothetical protein